MQETGEAPAGPSAERVVLDGSRTRVPGGLLKRGGLAPLPGLPGPVAVLRNDAHLGVHRLRRCQRAFGLAVVNETPPANVIADTIHSRMFCAPRLTNAYHFSRHSYSAFRRSGGRRTQSRSVIGAGLRQRASSRRSVRLATAGTAKPRAAQIWVICTAGHTCNAAP